MEILQLVGLVGIQIRVFSWEAAAKNKPAGGGESQNYLEAQVWFTEKFW